MTIQLPTDEELKKRYNITVIDSPVQAYRKYLLDGTDYHEDVNRYAEKLATELIKRLKDGL